MSILSIKPEKITPEALASRGFTTGEWGSLHTRATRNTTMYVLLIEEDWIIWSVMYFPPEFEGVVTPTGCVMDMRGKVMMQKENNTTQDKYIINVTDMTDIDVFIKQVLRNKVKPFKYERFSRTCRARIE